jgi:hypothetical protein
MASGAATMAKAPSPKAHVTSVKEAMLASMVLEASDAEVTAKLVSRQGPAHLGIIHALHRWALGSSR